MWVDLALVDYYLLYQWYEICLQSSIHYIDLQTANGWDMDSEARKRMEIFQIPRFRKQYFLPMDHASPIVPVVFMILQVAHFFTVVLDHANSLFLILGRSSWAKDDEDWEKWHGPSIYSHICLLHGWSVPDDMSIIKIQAVSWKGNGYNCGPVTVGVVLKLFDHGLEDHSLDSIKQAASTCGHLTCLSIYLGLNALMSE